MLSPAADQRHTSAEHGRDPATPRPLRPEWHARWASTGPNRLTAIRAGGMMLAAVAAPDKLSGNRTCPNRRGVGWQRESAEWSMRAETIGRTHVGRMTALGLGRLLIAQSSIGWASAAWEDGNPGPATD